MQMLTRFKTVSTISLLLTSPTWIKPMSTANFILIFRIGTEGFITPAGRTTAPDPDTIMSPVTEPVTTCCPEPGGAAGGGGASRSVSEAEPGAKTGFSLDISDPNPKKERSPRSHLLLYHRALSSSIKYRWKRKILDQVSQGCPPPPPRCAHPNPMLAAVQRDAQNEITSNVWRNGPSLLPMSAEDRCGVGLCCLSQDAILTPPVCGSAHHACVLLPDCQSKGGNQAGARARVPLIGVSALGKSD